MQSPTPALLVLAFIASSTFLLGNYNPTETHEEASYSLKQVSQLAKAMDAEQVKPVILHRMKPVNPLIDLFADDGQPVNQAIRKREALAASRDNSLPVARPLRRLYASR